MKSHINLIPLNNQLRQLVWRRSCQWAVVVCAVLGLSLLGGWIQWRHSLAEETRQRLLIQQALPMRKLQKQVEQTRLQMDELKQHDKLRLVLAGERPMITLVGLVSRAAAQCDSRVSVQRLAVQQRQSVLTEKTNSVDLLELEGIAVNHLDVTRFVAALRDSRVFQQVQLKYSESQKQNQIEAQRYRVECTYGAERRLAQSETNPAALQAIP